MKDTTMLKTGLIGGAVAGLCCFTPVLVVTFSAIGLTAIVAWLDYVLLPALVIFAGVTVIALVRLRTKAGEAGTSR